jgi:antitoxin (DNA-binding transcriptional repressor) of toxin-antitoxin stability system
VVRIISQQELRNNSAEIMRALDLGESFIITRGDLAVGELRSSSSAIHQSGRAHDGI